MRLYEKRKSCASSAERSEPKRNATKYSTANRCRRNPKNRKRLSTQCAHYMLQHLACN